MRCIALLVVSVSLANVSGVAGQVSAESGPPYIETVGTGQRRVAPDRASVHLIIESRAASAATAAAQNGRAVQAVQDTLRRAGLDSAPTTSSYHVGQDYERMRMDRPGEPRPIGYVARTVLRVRLTRLENVGRVIDVGLAKGATGVESAFFEASNAEEERRAALAEAALAARRDAEALARALGGSLGPILSTSTAAFNDPRRGNVMFESIVPGEMARGPAITPNEIVISAAVIARWRFNPAP
jgi:uncharacterized protein YggE